MFGNNHSISAGLLRVELFVRDGHFDIFGRSVSSSTLVVGLADRFPRSGIGEYDFSTCVSEVDEDENSVIRQMSVLEYQAVFVWGNHDG